MLIQSHTGIVLIFPAVPADWMDISFQQLRTVGAFLVSAKREGGSVTQVKIKSTSGGILKLKNPFKNNDFECSQAYQIDQENVLHFQTTRGDEIEFKSK
ncbi:MAG: hypothetical protein IPL46_29880 [Saprospiraceae bacterium]|nr:hypothetical protein [Saprospiraceae bacterium]